MFKGFKNFLMRGDVITAAVGLVVALAFSTLVKAFTDSVINPLVSAAQGGQSLGLGWQLNSECKGANATSASCKATFLDIGTFISAIIYFVIFMAVVYFVLVVPYRHIMKRRGKTVFGPEPETDTCPACLSNDLPIGATKCKYCATDLTPSGDSGGSSGAHAR